MHVEPAISQDGEISFELHADTGADRIALQAFVDVLNRVDGRMQSTGFTMNAFGGVDRLTFGAAQP